MGSRRTKNPASPLSSSVCSASDFGIQDLMPATTRSFDPSSSAWILLAALGTVAISTTFRLAEASRLRHARWSRLSIQGKIRGRNLHHQKVSFERPILAHGFSGTFNEVVCVAYESFAQRGEYKVSPLLFEQATAEFGSRSAMCSVSVARATKVLWAADDQFRSCANARNSSRCRVSMAPLPQSFLSGYLIWPHCAAVRKSASGVGVPTELSVFLHRGRTSTVRFRLHVHTMEPKRSLGREGGVQAARDGNEKEGFIWLWIAEAS